jgi:hypothetical protein
MPLTDEQLADSVTSSDMWRKSRWRLNPKSHAQFIDLVWLIICQHSHIPPEMRVEKWENVCKILKMRSTKKALVTRKKNKIKQLDQDSLARQGDLFK